MVSVLSRISNLEFELKLKLIVVSCPALALACFDKSENGNHYDRRKRF